MKKTVLVGCCLGAWTALEMATKCPERFEQLILVSPLGIKHGPKDRLTVPDIFAMSQDALDKLLYVEPAKHNSIQSQSDEALQAAARGMEAFALVAWEPYMHNPKLIHRLKRINSPTLIVRGESDGLLSAELAACYKDHIKGAKLSTIAGAGHVVEIEKPQLLADEIKKFVKQFEGALS